MNNLSAGVRNADGDARGFVKRAGLNADTTPTFQPTDNLLI